MAGRRWVTRGAVLTAFLVATPPGGVPPASAAPAAKLVIDCRPSLEECWPTAFVFTPNGRQVFYVERFTGQIRRFTFKGRRDGRWGSVGPVDGDGERGTLGIALDPRWNKGPRQRWVYVFFTQAQPLENKVVRLRKKPKRPGFVRQELLSIRVDPPNSNHNGGPIHFGPDGKLYVVTGDQGRFPERSQDLGDPGGKVLRLNRNGGRPADNPIPGSLAYSFGHRNSFGFTFDPRTDRLWQTENGPNCNDEVNLVVRGGNHAWGPDGTSCSGTPDVTQTNRSGPDPKILPEVNYGSVLVPTGTVFCERCGLDPAVEGDLLVATFVGQVRDLSLSASRDAVVDDTVLYQHDEGVLAMAARRSGQLYFSDEDGIYRLVAA
jgi:glucose/arabinose dehydrogenase